MLARISARRCLRPTARTGCDDEQTEQSKRAQHTFPPERGLGPTRYELIGQECVLGRRGLLATARLGIRTSTHASPQVRVYRWFRCPRPNCYLRESLRNAFPRRRPL